jgi:hypothetical protein
MGAGKEVCRFAGDHDAGGCRRRGGIAANVAGESNVFPRATSRIVQSKDGF